MGGGIPLGKASAQRNTREDIRPPTIPGIGDKAGIKPEDDWASLSETFCKKREKREVIQTQEGEGKGTKADDPRRGLFRGIYQVLSKRQGRAEE